MLDDKDKIILELLKQNSKLTTSKISKKTAIPVTTVHNRIKKLKKEKYIQNYTVNINHEKLGLKISAFILLTVNYELKDGTKIMQEDVARKIKSLPEVDEVNVVTGGTDIVLKVRTTDVKALNDFVIDKLRMIKGVDKTQTMVILSEY